jgi:hypothetical protein
MSGDLGGHSVGPCHPIHLLLNVTCTSSRTVQALRRSCSIRRYISTVSLLSKKQGRIKWPFYIAAHTMTRGSFRTCLASGNCEYKCVVHALFLWDSSAPVGVASVTSLPSLRVCARIRKYHLRSWTVGIPWPWRHDCLSSILPWQNHISSAWWKSVTVWWVFWHNFHTYIF